MANKNEEQISALVDGEVRGSEIERALDSLRDDPSVSRRWARYHLISDALRNNLPDFVSPDLHVRVARALEREPALLVPSLRIRIPPMARRVAGLALAASVTAAAILGVQNMNRDEEREQVATANEPTQAQTVDESRIQERLDPYLVNHSEYSASSGMQRMLPYVRLVGQDEGD